MELRGVFLGLCTVDVVQLAPRFPGPDDKVVALDRLCVAGGPAANAAATFSHLGHRARLITALGHHPTSAIARDDLEACGVDIFDLDPDETRCPTISCVIVTAKTGQRAVVSTNAAGKVIDARRFDPAALDGASVLMIDGHHMEVALEAARCARDRGVEVVLDGGSWKPGMEGLLPLVDVAVCSERFAPPGIAPGGADVLRFLRATGVESGAVTRGPRPIIYTSGSGEGELRVEKVEAVDTLGAGDIFHGAFCALAERPFVDRLAGAAKVASGSCLCFGTRAWMHGDDNDSHAD
jgi:sugar/nucleoside kinase (ribokinase family)